MADTSQTPVTKWHSTIATYDNEFKRWEQRTTKIIKRYRDDNRSQSGTHSAKFNILWSNVQTLIPAVYAKLPKCDVSRRFGDIEFTLFGRPVHTWAESVPDEHGSPSSLGRVVPIPHTVTHGVNIGPKGGSFLSVQQWLNDTPVERVSDNWKAK